VFAAAGAPTKTTASIAKWATTNGMTRRSKRRDHLLLDGSPRRGEQQHGNRPPLFSEVRGVDAHADAEGAPGEEDPESGDADRQGEAETEQCVAHRMLRVDAEPTEVRRGGAPEQEADEGDREQIGGDPEQLVEEVEDRTRVAARDNRGRLVGERFLVGHAVDEGDDRVERRHPERQPEHDDDLGDDASRNRDRRRGGCHAVGRGIAHAGVPPGSR
jgi:hypothetical protein